jgi:3-oxoacyl-[acyl-carrier protein] reductase
MQLANKVAVITGGNSGIGKAIAIALARNGANIVIAGRRQRENARTAHELSGPYRVLTTAIPTDVAKEEDCERLIKESVKQFGAIHILVNSAGIIGGDTIARTPTRDFDRVLKTNLYGTFWCARAAYKQIQKNKSKAGEPRGIIINISSLAGKSAWTGTGVYSASKFGIMGLTQALADEGKHDNIKAMAICPAMVATPMTGKKGWITCNLTTLPKLLST